MKRSVNIVPIRSHSTSSIPQRYREGRLTALEYIGELTFYYLQEEKKIQDQFKEQIHKQIDVHSCLEDTEYKQGLYDALEEMLD